MILKGGTLYYDTVIGVLCLESNFPKPRGHVRNPRSFDFPVVCRVVPGVDVPGLLFTPTSGLLDLFLEAARQLEKDGVKAITGSCGFLARFHSQVADAVTVPVFMSSLLQIPLVRMMHGADAKIGVLTASREALSEEHFQGCGCSMEDVIIMGMEGTTEFWETIIKGIRNDFNMEKLEREVCGRAEKLVRENALDALVLECTDLSTFTAEIQRRVGVPVYDLNSLVEYVAYSVCRKRY